MKVLPDEPQGYSAPYIGPIDDSGNEYLMIGSGAGAIYRFTGFQNGNVTVPYTLLDTMYSEIRIPGQFSSVSFGDLTGDNKYELFVGNGKGGVFAYRQVWNVGVDEVGLAEGETEVFPNPAKDRLTIKGGGDFSGQSALRLIDNMGRVFKPGFHLAGNLIHVDISALPAGIYICMVTSDNNQFKNLFIKQ